MPKKQTNNEDAEPERRFDQELLKKGLRRDLGQYERLKDCSDKKDMTEWNEWRRANNTIDIELEGRDFMGWWLEGVNFCKANLDGAKFHHAKLNGAEFNMAEIAGTNFRSAEIRNAKFPFAVVDGRTLFFDNIIDKRTWFWGVALQNIRIENSKRTLLEYNIRRVRWEQWYKKNPHLVWLFRLFWLMSDYGISTKRIIATFFVLAFVFANIYYHWGRIAPPGIVENLFVDHNGVAIQWWLVPLRTLYFSIVTQTTLGFGDMYANAHSIFGHILLSIQVMLGYVLLGALITRFAVLFTAGGPAGKFAKGKKSD